MTVSQKKSQDTLSTLLLQVRDSPIVRREEHESFCDYSGLSQEQVHVLNVFDTTDFTPDVIDNYDALFIGGASEASVSDPTSFPFHPSIALIHHCLERDIPVFASCFGFQLGVVALGGELKKDTVNFEMGTVPMQLTPAAKDDPLFCDVPDGFHAISVHQESAIELPESCELLARTPLCCHAYRVKGKPFWGFQFHPELDVPRLTERLGVYKESYTDSEEHFQEIIAGLHGVAESHLLLKKFVERVLR
ncbi:MAG: type 1 glutamine amidotransferase [Desulfobulbaceae bacterium]|nr:MAG: type 1 glutamine amidotransferase [Desulfobulbaceae bacterium]